MNLINDAMLVIDSSGPISRQGMFQGFGLAYTIERLSLDFFNERINTLEYFLIRLLPEYVIFPSLFRKD